MKSWHMLVCSAAVPLVMLWPSRALAHTLGIFTLGLVALFASQYVLPEQLYPWLGVMSGLIVVGLGGAMLWSRVRPLLVRHEHDHHYGSQDHDHDSQNHAHEHDHRHDHER